MADLKKIQEYLDQIKEWHLNGIHHPHEILSRLLQLYLSQKKSISSLLKSSGVLFGNNAPAVYAKQVLWKINQTVIDENEFYDDINAALTRHFKNKHYKLNGKFSALWVAFLYYYHPVLPASEKDSFFKKAILTGFLVKEKKQRNDVDDFLMEINDDDYRSFSQSNSRLVSMIKICGTAWIKPIHHTRIVDNLMKLPYWENQNLDDCHENTLIAVSTLESLIPKEMIKTFYTHILTNLADDIESIHYKTLSSISKIPFSNIDDTRIIDSLKSVINHRYMFEEYTDEDTSEYRSCIILEILLKITKDPNIHDIIYKRISDLLASDQDNSVEILLQNITIPDHYKKIYVYQLLDNLQHRRRGRYDTTNALKKLINTEEDTEKLFSILLRLIENKHCLNSVFGIKNIVCSSDKQQELKELILKLLKNNTFYLGIEIIRVVKFDKKNELELLSMLRPLLKENHPAAIVDAMRYLPFTPKDHINMVSCLLKATESEHEHYAIRLLSKLPIPVEFMKKTTHQLMSRITDDDIVTSQTLLTLSLIHKDKNIFLYTDRQALLNIINTQLTHPNFDSCIEKICHAIANFSFSASCANQLIPSLINLVNKGNALMIKAAIFTLTRIDSPIEAKPSIIQCILKRINYAVNLCYHTDIIIEDINNLIRYTSENFSAVGQLGLCAMIEKELRNNPIIADDIISRIILAIKVENTLNEYHRLPREMVKHVYHFS